MDDPNPYEVQLQPPPAGGDITRLLTAVMDDVRAVTKDGYNRHGGYNFRGIDAVVNAVSPALRRHGVVVTPHLDQVEYADVTTTGGKAQTACRVVATYRFAAPDGSVLSATVPGESWDSADKSTPQAMSVAFRTALLQALCLPTDDLDPDAQHPVKEAPLSWQAVRHRAAGYARRGANEQADVLEWLADREVDEVVHLDADGLAALSEQLDEWEQA